MRYNQVVSQHDSFIHNSFSNVQTQQSPCCFRFCQSNLQSGIIKSVLQRQRREPFKALTISLIFIRSRKFDCKDNQSI